jgi:hypothetical protein
MKSWKPKVNLLSKHRCWKSKCLMIYYNVRVKLESWLYRWTVSIAIHCLFSRFHFCKSNNFVIKVTSFKFNTHFQPWYSSKYSIISGLCFRRFYCCFWLIAHRKIAATRTNATGCCSFPNILGLLGSVLLKNLISTFYWPRVDLKNFGKLMLPVVVSRNVLLGTICGSL